MNEDNMSNILQLKTVFLSSFLLRHKEDISLDIGGRCNDVVNLSPKPLLKRNVYTICESFHIFITFYITAIDNKKTWRT